MARRTVMFSSGPPLSICQDDLLPRHGFPPQSGDPPVEIVTDRHQMTPDTYLRVTVRSRRAFKGFVVRAENDTGEYLGSWYIPYLADDSYMSESQYLHCGGSPQSGVTHSGNVADMWVVSFQWRPDREFSGWVVFRGTVVVSYSQFWTNIMSARVMVRGEGDPGTSGHTGTDIRNSYYHYNRVGDNTEQFSHGDNYTDFMSLFQDYSDSDEEMKTRIGNSSDMKDDNQVRALSDILIG